MNYVSPDKVFMFLLSSCSAITLILYLIIAFSQLRMRRKIEQENPELLKVKMWLFPYLTYLTIVVTTALLIAMFFIESMRSQILFTCVIVAIVMIFYMLTQKKKVIKQADESSSLFTKDKFDFEQ
ncbi:GABA permease [compost metagenome]